MAHSLDREEPHYFGAGPAALPTSVLQQAAHDLLNYEGSGLGVGEISHRSGPAGRVIDDTKAHFKELLSIPDTHEVFFLQGGGTTGFSSIATNLLAAYVKKTGKKGRAAYAITGAWSEKAHEEAARLGVETEVLTNSKKVYGSFGKIQPFEEWKKPVPEETAYVYYCENETVNGVEFQYVPHYEGIETVADLSSDILSREIDVSKYGLIVAGAQKNVGLAGISIYIIKKTLLEQASDEELRALNAPLSFIAFHFPTVVKNNSAYNTIPIFTVHILKLVLENLIENGGVAEKQKINERKAEKLYNVLDSYPELFNLPVEKSVRSKMNVVFTIKKDGLEAEFLAKAQEQKLTGLKGHRSVGGFRASLYNAVSEESVDLLVEFIKKFAQEHK